VRGRQGESSPGAKKNAGIMTGLIPAFLVVPYSGILSTHAVGALIPAFSP